MGNTKKLGAMLGILKAIGAYVPEPGSVMWTVFMLVQRTFTTVFGALLSCHRLERCDVV